MTSGSGMTKVSCKELTEIDERVDIGRLAEFVISFGDFKRRRDLEWSVPRLKGVWSGLRLRPFSTHGPGAGGGLLFNMNSESSCIILASTSPANGRFGLRPSSDIPPYK